MMHVPKSTEHEVEEVPPASANPGCMSVIPINGGSHVSDEQLEQEDRREIGCTVRVQPLVNAHLSIST